MWERSHPVTSREILAPRFPCRVPLTNPRAWHDCRYAGVPALVIFEKPDDGLFCPPAVVAVGIGEEGAVAAVCGLDVGDVRVSQQLRARLRQDADEWIVERVDDQCRQRDVLDRSRRSGAVIVIVSPVEAGVTRGDL